MEYHIWNIKGLFSKNLKFRYEKIKKTLAL